MKKYLFLLALALPMLTGFAMSEISADHNCPTPSNVTIVGQSPGTVAFDWDDCGCGQIGYQAYYRRHSDGYVSPVVRTKASAHVFSGLPSGTYDFYFRTDCGNLLSEIIGVEEVFIG